MGLLLNFVVNDITSSILLLEDIAADFAFQLHQLLGGMIEKMPSLLQPEHQGLKCRNFGSKLKQ
jgi:hypothetical protein